MDAATRSLVRRRADNRCEYCLLHQDHSHLAHHVEPIVARQHGGTDDLDNLALACHRCNLCKGPNLTGFDRESGRIVPLFHPRRDHWTRHFAWRGPRVEGLTAIGRATVLVLGMNDARRMELRAELLTRHGLA
jgi:5-methylcytosine-specific restriction endonuclease McrA